MNILDVNKAIMFGNFTDTELASIIDAVRFARAGLVKRAKRELQPGVEVSFYSAKRGMTVKGKITKIATKYATVSTVGGLWKVPMNMLEVVA